MVLLTDYQWEGGKGWGKNGIESLRDHQKSADPTLRSADVGNSRTVILKKARENEVESIVAGRSTDRRVRRVAVLSFQWARRPEDWYTLCQEQFGAVPL